MKIVQIFYCVLFLSLMACNKEDSLSSDTLEGTWNLTSISCDDGISSTTISGETFSATFKASGKNYNASLTFTGNKFKSKGTYTTVTTSTYDGSTFVNEATQDYFENDGTWVRENDFLVLTVPGFPQQKIEILKLDSKTFEYKQIADETIDQGGGAISNVKGTFFYKLSR